VRPEAAPPEVLRQKAAAPLRASRRAWLAAERRQTRMLRKVAKAPEAPARSEAASSAALRPKLIMLEVVEGLVFFLAFFRAAIASGLVAVILRTFSAPLPKRVVLNAFARRMRL
jgi:hypothetical protein